MIPILQRTEWLFSNYALNSHVWNETELWLQAQWEAKFSFCLSHVNQESPGAEVSGKCNDLYILGSYSPVLRLPFSHYSCIYGLPLHPPIRGDLDSWDKWKRLKSCLALFKFSDTESHRYGQGVGQRAGKNWNRKHIKMQTYPKVPKFLRNISKKILVKISLKLELSFHINVTKIWSIQRWNPPKYDSFKKTQIFREKN